jgi:hypothetical protein
LGDSAHHDDVRTRNRAVARKTGRLPTMMAVGEMAMPPTPSPSMYTPVVSATLVTGTPSSCDTSVKPAASTGVMPPRIMQ